MSVRPVTTRTVPTRTGESTALDRLGARLRAVREHAGLTGTELAVALGAGWAQPKISKIETGRQLPTEAEVAAWAAATGVAVQPLVSLRELADAEQPRDRPHRSTDPATLAESCTRIGVFEPSMVPERLQTAAYLRHSVAATLPGDGREAAAVGHAVAAGIHHQALLYEPGREFVHVLTEAALRLRIGAMTVATLRGQLLHLAELATLPDHTLGVLPFETACPVPPNCGFALYDSDVVRVQTPAGTLQVTDADAVDRYELWLDLLVDSALTGAGAAAFCRTVAAGFTD